MQAVIMKFKPTALAAALLLGTLSLNANAALTSYTNEGVDLVYSSVSDVTWTKDANLFKTMYDADPNLISKIAAVTSTYNDPYWGLQTISAAYVGFSDDADFFINGKVTWWGALAFVNYLNSINYSGSSKWRLPTISSFIGDFLPPSNGGVLGDEFSELFYYELGGKAGAVFPNTATFDNENYAYWTGTEYDAANWYASYFISDTPNHRSFDYKNYWYFAWAVSPGMVSSIPEADTSAMLLAGLGIMGAVLRRRA